MRETKTMIASAQTTSMKKRLLRHDLRSNAGFTLIELMIVVMIVGILAAIVIPNYSEYIKRARRGAVQDVLMQIGQKQTQYLQLMRTGYAPTMAVLALPIPDDVGKDYEFRDSLTGTVGKFELTSPPPYFRIYAIPTAGGRMDGDRWLAIDATGKRSWGKAGSATEEGVW